MKRRNGSAWAVLVLAEGGTQEAERERNATHVAPVLPEGGTRDQSNFYIKEGAPSTGAVGTTLRALPPREKMSGAPDSEKGASRRAGVGG